MKLPAELEPIIERFEKADKPFSEFEAVDAIRNKIREVDQTGRPITPEMKAEWMAFDFMANYPEDRNTWYTYFGPMMTWKTKEEKIVESPSIENISEAILDYWGNRSQEVTHPLLRARYADLVWDFSKPVTKKTPNVVFAQRAIDSYLELITKALYEHAITGISYAKRALDLAISLNDSKRIESVRDAIIKLEGEICEVEAPGTWGFAFDILVGNSKAKLGDNQRQVLIDRLENILATVADAAESEKTIEPFVGEHAGLRLAAYYRRTNKPEEVKRVLKLYAKTFQVLSKKAGPMLAHGWLRQVHENFSEYGLKEEAEQLAVQLRELGQEAKKDMREFSHQIQIPVAEVEQFLNQLLDGNLEQVFGRVAAYFTPDSKKVEEQVKKLAEVAPLMSILSANIMGNDGRDIATVGSVENDLEGRVVLQMAQNLQIESIFLQRAIEELAKRFGLGSQELIGELYKSPVFEESRRVIIKKGLDAFFLGDHATAVHLLIPQIEQAFRQLLILCQRPTFKCNRQGGHDLRVLDEILRDPAIVAFFSESKAGYLRVLLTDRRGWNLRNNLCHGITEPDSIGQATSDRVIHVLMILGWIRKRETVSSVNNSIFI